MNEWIQLGNCQWRQWTFVTHRCLHHSIKAAIWTCLFAAVVAFINCDPAVIGLRLNQSHMMWLRVRDGLLGRRIEDIFLMLFISVSAEWGRWNCVCVYVCAWWICGCVFGSTFELRQRGRLVLIMAFFWLKLICLGINLKFMFYLKSCIIQWNKFNINVFVHCMPKFQLPTPHVALSYWRHIA